MLRSRGTVAVYTADMRRPRYRLLPHTADARLAVWGADETELIGNAVVGIVRVAAGREVGGPVAERAPVSPWPAALPDRLVRAANEALFQLLVRGRAAVGFEPLEDGGAIQLVPLPAWFRPAVEIKAVTYHDLRVVRAGARLRAVLTLDL